MGNIEKSSKLAKVYYEIRGAVLREAKRMEEDGHRILKLHIGNPAPFGFEAPEDILKDVIHNLPTAQGYDDAKGIYSARVAVMQYYQQKGLRNIEIDDIYIGNGVSELIVMAMQGLLNNGDEVLVPMPDYPLWTAAVNLSGGNAVHYVCDEKADWYPDVADMESKINENTRALVLINPNNPTGAVYNKDLLLDVIELARNHKLIIFSDEIYDKILFDGVSHTSIATLTDDIFVVTLGGLSKNYRIAGFRSGWMVLSGAKYLAEGYIEGLDILAAMRMCANVPCQHAIQTALGGYQSINDLINPGGRLKVQRDVAYQMLADIPGVSVKKPDGAMYLFARLDQKKFNIKDDEKMMMDLLRQEKMLLVQGSAFNMKTPEYFRLVFLPHQDVLKDAISRLGRFFESYRQ